MPLSHPELILDCWLLKLSTTMIFASWVNWINWVAQPLSSTGSAAISTVSVTFCVNVVA